MKTADELKDEAIQFATEAHCRYCAIDGHKCARDIEDMAAAYIEALHAYGEEVKEVCAAIPDRWVNSNSCNEDAERNPCSHIRMASRIAWLIRNLKLP